MGCGWGGSRGERGSLVMLPLHWPSLCTSLAGVKYVCVEGLWSCLQRSGHLCVTPCDG